MYKITVCFLNLKLNAFTKLNANKSWNNFSIVVFNP